VADLDAPGGETTVQEIEAQGGRGIFFRTDVSSRADAQAVVAHTLERWGDLHVLHNNAYWAPTDRTVMNTSDSEWNRTMDVTLKSIYLMSRAALPHMLEHRRGAIVNTASVAGLLGSARFSAYAAAKGGVISLTKSMATDFGKNGVRVNCVAPGPIRTPATAELEKDPVWMERQTRRMLLGRLGEPNDIAYAVLFLASDEASWVTGATFVLDGGSTSH
jgi:NAD(P)-dependent dehydrogenase (short-subunit alcohol dehydrogenase family)